MKEPRKQERLSEPFVPHLFAQRKRPGLHGTITMFHTAPFTRRRTYTEITAISGDKSLLWRVSLPHSSTPDLSYRSSHRSFATLGVHGNTPFNLNF